VDGWRYNACSTAPTPSILEFVGKLKADASTLASS
jgi:hypothetical protein